MAKLENVKNGLSRIQSLVDGNSSHLENMINSPHIKYLNTTPYFCTLYTQDKFLSTTATGWEDEYRHVGSESPTRYNKVTNFPLFLESELSKSKDDTEEAGWTEIVNGSAIALPKTVRIKQNDIFVIEYEGAPLYYKVGKVESTRIRSNPYLKFEFDLHKSPEYDPVLGYESVIADTQIVGEYKCLYDNIGTEFKTIIRNSDTEVIAKVLDAMTLLRTSYNDIFYYNDHYLPNVMVLDTAIEGTGDEIIYSPLLVEFINRTGIINNQYGDRLLLDHEVDTNRNFKSLYNKSIYKKIEDSSDIQVSNKLYVDQMLGANTFSVLKTCMRDVNVLYPQATMFTTEVEAFSGEIQNMVNNLSVDTTPHIANSLVRHIDKTDFTDDEINLFKTYDVSATLSDFTIIPLVIFALSKYCERFMLDNLIESNM
jgi:hypothetical protein